MPEVVLEGVPVRFPFEPYEVQQAYMSKVLRCLQNGDNGILESPTGTGKTLCLLCSTLGWLEVKKAEYKSRLHTASSSQDTPEFLASLSSQLISGTGQAWGGKNAPPKIIYSSRTHSQLSQAVSELKRTTYSYLRMAVLGSRDQMCIHPEVSKETNNNSKVHMCQMRVKAKTCYFNNQVDVKKEEPEVRQGVHDLEDLVKLGKKKTFCPYYMARELRQDADIIFLPYNYLLDPKTRKAHGIETQGNIVIFDEAHNIEKMCEEAASLQIRSTDLALCIDEVTQVMKKFQDASEGSTIAANDSSQALPEDFSPDDLYTLKALFLELEKAIDVLPLPSDGTGTTYPGSFMFELLEKADITPGKKTIILEVLDKLIQYLTTNSSSPFQRKGAGLQKFSDLIKIVFSKDNFSLHHMEFVKQCYKVHVNIEEPKKRPEGWGAPKPNTLTSKAGRVISYWCFNPGFGMKDLAEQGAKCIILTSGTLSPLDSFTSELQVPFPIQLENPHIIQPYQVWVGTVCCGPDGFTLNSSFKNRSDPRYVTSLGQTILNLSRVIPGGLLVFFPSYTVLRSCRDDWQASGIWSKISVGKPIFVEPQIKEEFLNAMEEFYQKINDPAFKGACFMAVCRGKVSEGLDFADRNGRAVIITGLPYPPFKDPRVVLKQKYLEESRAKNKRGLSGQAWYQLEASRAVNQAIGRVIRHKDDFGAIILCDNRFAAGGFRQQLSAWVRPHVNVYNNFGPAIRDVINFFKNAKNLLPQPEAKKGQGEPAISIQYEAPGGSSLPPVPAQALQSASSRIIISDSTRKKLAEARANQDTDYNTSNWETNDYSGVKKGEKRTNRGDGSLFSALEEKSSIVNFNNFQASSSSASPSHIPADYNSIKINNKKRKIKLVAKKIPERLESLSEGTVVSNNVSPHILKPLNPAAELCRESESCEGLQESLPSGQKESLLPGHVPPVPTTSKQETGENQKLKSIAVYIKEVKSCLSKEKYGVFSALVKSYQKDKDYTAMMGILSGVFSEEPQQRRLFRKFEQFLIKEHRAMFQAACS
ncbi:hypothetical protein Pcinc_029539 [Petrolisthes cinctipes]|uniref:Regulator of telomere elongation helicase 1 homolog n=1 Tax=Petrolisthes cinctipes TaxID=88211 RepID=A0AAE1F146_PETCI|nr:hypothetical protein Pcinc_029539 [Petrolisthes cinctipes]